MSAASRPRGRPGARVLGAAILTLAGVAVLLGLMTWQIRRLAWKTDLIAMLEARLSAEPVPLPPAPDPAIDEFRRVAVSGRFLVEPGAHGFPDAAYLTTMRPSGPGYRIVQPFEAEDGRRLLVDRGYLPIAEKNEAGRAALPTPAPEGVVTVVGALRWPQEADWFADEDAGLADNVWLTRSVDRLAPLWNARPVLVVAETSTAVGDWPRPAPVTVDLPNDHLGYAVTWGGLAAVWAAMGGLLLRRELARR